MSGLISKFGLFAGVGGIAGVTLAVSKAVSTFSSFEKAVANAASVTGATGKVFEDTKTHIAAVSKELGESTVFSASQAASAFYDLASAGYDVAKMTKGDLQPILNLAAATQTDLKTTTEVTTSTLGQFGLGIESSGRIADVFAKTIGSSKATVDKLQYSLKYVGPVAHAMGMKIETVNAILGNLYNAGFQGEQAGAALRGAFSRLMNPTSEAAEALKKMGLSVEDVNPTTHKFADILDTLTASGMDANTAMQLFGQRAAPAMLALTDNTDGIRNLESALKDAGGTAETMAKEQLATFSGSITLLKSALEGVAITIGGAVAPYIKALAEWLTKAIPPTMHLAGQVKDALMPAFTKISNWIKNTIPKIEGFIETLVNKLKPAFESQKSIVGSLITIFSNLTSGIDSNEGTLTSFMPVVNAAVFVLNGLVSVLASVFGWFAEHPTITKAAAAITAAIIILTNPILLVTAAIAALSIAWSKDWLGIKTATLTVTSAISGVIDFFVDYIKTAISVFLDLISLNWSDAWNTISEFIAKWGTNTATLIEDIGKDLITALVDGISGALSGVWDIITGEKSVTSTIIGGLDLILPGAKAQGNAISTKVADGIKEKKPETETATKSVTSAIHTELEKAKPAAKTTGLDAMTAMADGIKSGTSAVSTAAASVVSAAKTEMDRLWALQQGEAYRKSLYVTVDEPSGGTPSGGTPPIPAGTIIRVGAYNNHHGNTGWSRRWANGNGNGGFEHDHILGSMNDAIGGRHVLQSVFDALTEPQQQDFKNSHGGIVDDTTHEVTQQFATGGYVPYDMNADIHKGEYVIPARGAPVLSGGKDINLNITYNMGDIIGIDDLQSILGQHDQKLLSKLQSLI